MEFTEGRDCNIHDNRNQKLQSSRNCNIHDNRNTSEIKILDLFTLPSLPRFLPLYTFPQARRLQDRHYRRRVSALLCPCPVLLYSILLHLLHVTLVLTGIFASRQ
jgi:hypothetical protein